MTYEDAQNVLSLPEESTSNEIKAAEAEQVLSQVKPPNHSNTSPRSNSEHPNRVRHIVTALTVVLGLSFSLNAYPRNQGQLKVNPELLSSEKAADAPIVNMSYEKIDRDLESQKLAIKADGGDILDPDVAFSLNAFLLDSNNILVNFDIADNHYLYKDKLTININDKNIVLDKYLPKSEIKNDEFFGKIEILKGRVRFKLPLGFERSWLDKKWNGEKPLLIKFKYQGSNEKLGIAYPPIRKTLKLKY